MAMSVPVALPSRPRAVRVVGLPAQTPLADGGSSRESTILSLNAATAPWTEALDRFVCEQPVRALGVLENWMTDSRPAAKDAHDVCA
jgi:hypothetical protein